MSERPPRLSIEERAERRRFVLSRGHDRFTALLRVLQGGRQVPIRHRGLFDDVDWGAVRWAGVKVLFAGVLLFAIGSFVYSIWRDLKVDTWSGPDATVQSGQRLRDCREVNQLASDGDLPSWIRYGDTVYARRGSLRPSSDPATGAVIFSESGYALGRMQLRVDGPPARRVLVVVPPATSGAVYEPVPDCR